MSEQLVDELSPHWQYGRLVPMPRAIPEAWSFVRLTDVARLESGHTPSRRHPEYWEGSIPWVSLHDSRSLDRATIDVTAQTIGELGLANSSARMLPLGTVVFSRTATVGKATVLGQSMATSQDFANYVCGPKLHNAFLMYLLRFLQPEWKRLMAGSTHNTIYMPVFENLQILMPPLTEQRKIAAILSSVDDAIEATQAVIDQLQVVKKAMMAELLTRGLPGRHTKFKMTEIGEVPEGWQTATYSELAADVPAAIQSGPFGSELKHSEFVSEGKLVIGIDNVLDGRFSMGAEHRITDAKFEELSRFQARPGDLLITVMATVGRCCVVPENIEPAIITKHVYRLTVNRSRANPYFLMHCLYGLARLANEVRGSAQGLTRPGLNKSLLLPLRFPLPSVQEQDAIVDALRGVDVTVRDREPSHGLPPVRRRRAPAGVGATGQVASEGVTTRSTVKPEPCPSFHRWGSSSATRSLG